MSAHAILSPSSASRWMACPGSVVLSEGMPDSSSEFADEGTDAHELAALCLDKKLPASSFEGDTMGKGNVVDADMVLYVQQYVDYVRAVVDATGGTLLVEQKLPISKITGEKDAKGTADAVILADRELIVIDLKYGRGVPVDAEDNPQLQIYGLAALREFELAGDFDQVRMVIHQPRLNSVSEWTQTIEELAAFDDQVAEAALNVANAKGSYVAWPSDRSQVDGWAEGNLFPGDKQCKFCKAKANCPALAARVQQEVGADFDSLTGFNREMTEASLQKHGGMPAEQLGTALAAVDLIEMWCKAVRAEVETRLLAGQGVPGFKLVQGKKGNRQWSSKEEAETVMKSMRLKHDQMYDYSVISPTSAEKLAKAEVIGPRQWPKLQSLITQTEGKPSVAPESDKRPALSVAAVADDFADVSTEAVADLA